ncbi:MAG: dihydroneopterin aldolase [Anaerolineaceae bacterium]|nr:dihydroneopterin aldolase [Anaerolineaceae bacterium]
MDKIFIRNLKIKGILGVYDVERHYDQEILINIIMTTDTKKAGISDRVEESIDYHEMAKRIHAHVVKIKRYTVEALAEDIAVICLQHNLVQGVTVRVEKPEALEICDTVGVEITREK